MTNAMSATGYFLMVTVFLSGLALAPPAQGHVATPDGQQQSCEPVTDDFTTALADDLKERGFQVSQGCPMLYPVEDCKDYTYPLLKNCFFNNPAAPYVIPVMKSWPDEYIDPALVNAFGLRDSIASGTERGPDPSKLLTPRILRFTKP